MSMRNDKNTIDFLRSLARSTTGSELIRYLEKIEKHYCDIRNLEEGSAEARIEALKIFREALLDKLISLRSSSASSSLEEEYT